MFSSIGRSFGRMFSKLFWNALARWRGSGVGGMGWGRRVCQNPREQKLEEREIKLSQTKVKLSSAKKLSKLRSFKTSNKSKEDNEQWFHRTTVTPNSINSLKYAEEATRPETKKTLSTKRFLRILQLDSRIVFPSPPSQAKTTRLFFPFFFLAGERNTNLRRQELTFSWFFSSPPPASFDRLLLSSFCCFSFFYLSAFIRLIILLVAARGLT